MPNTGRSTEDDTISKLAIACERWLTTRPGGTGRSLAQSEVMELAKELVVKRWAPQSPAAQTEDELAEFALRILAPDISAKRQMSKFRSLMEEALKRWQAENNLEEEDARVALVSTALSDEQKRWLESWIKVFESNPWNAHGEDGMQSGAEH